MTKSCLSKILWLLVGGLHLSAAWLLPDGFKMEFDETTGWELQWKSLKGNRVQVGGARPEFRIAGGSGGSSSVLFGYPLETSEGGLRLPVSAKQQEQLSNNGANLEVWSSGRRLDKGDEHNILASNTQTHDSPAPVTPAVDINPAAKGNFPTSRLWYNLSALGNVPDFPVPIEVVAEVTRPVLKSGKSPLVLFLHGRHSTCYDPSIPGMISLDWPCFSGSKPIPGHKGYRYVADILASQGYLTVSIAANGINGQDGNVADSGASARSILIRHHLVLWAKWNRGLVKDPWGGIFKGKVDLSKVVLVGHSRGGEGVNRAAVDASSSDPFKIVGLVSYGPTSFGRQVRPDVHSATILPTCDGDVSDLQGQAYIDESRDVAYSNALRTAVISIGTNHNYYNTEWTPGISVAPSNDDWYDQLDPVCGDQASGSLRLTPKEQQAVGAAYTCALVRFAVKQDQDMLQFLDGSFVKPKSIGRAEVVTHAVGGASYRLLYKPQNVNDTTAVVGLQNGMKGNVCKGYSSSMIVDFRATEIPTCASGTQYPSPHWLPMYGADQRPAPLALELRWEKRNSATTFTVPSINLNSFNSINIRIANDPNEEAAKLELWILDSTGNNSTLKTNLVSIDGWPGTGSIDRVHAHTFRGDIATANKQVNLKSVVGIALVAISGSGRVWILDVAVSRALVSKPTVLDLPVVSIASINLTEGNGPRNTYIPVTADRIVSSPISFWVQQGSGDNYTLTIPAGSRSARIPFSWVGDNLYGTSSFYNSFVLAQLSGALTGNYIGGVTIVEDDPVPTLSAVKAAATATKGESLEWTLLLSNPTAGIAYYLIFIPPISGTELTSKDVDPNWLSQYLWSPPAWPVQLSRLLISIGVQFGPNVTNATLSIPLANDFTTAKNKYIRLELRAFDNPTVVNRIVLTGIARNST